jgi:chromosome segregation ATPase
MTDQNENKAGEQTTSPSWYEDHFELWFLSKYPKACVGSQGYSCRKEGWFAACGFYTAQIEQLQLRAEQAASEHRNAIQQFADRWNDLRQQLTQAEARIAEMGEALGIALDLCEQFAKGSHTEAAIKSALSSTGQSYIDKCEQLQRRVNNSDSISHAEKKILLEEIEQHTQTKQKLEEACETLRWIANQRGFGGAGEAYALLGIAASNARKRLQSLTSTEGKETR